MNWSTESRQSLMRGLDAVDRALVVFYRMLLALIVTAVLVVAGYVAVQKPFGAGNQGEYFYFGIAVLVALGWAVGQFAFLERRSSRTWPAVTVDSSAQDGAYTWQLQLGGPTSKANENAGGGLQFGFSRDFTFPLTSLPAGIVPDEAALAFLKREIERGVSLEEASTVIQPQFAEWSGLQRKAYCLLVNSLLDQQSTTKVRF
jgi:hypothetical protein